MVSAIHFSKLLFVIVLGSATACSGEKTTTPCSSETAPSATALLSTTDLPATHLIFAGIDVLSSPWQSSVHLMDLKSGEVSNVSSGESGDPMVVRREDSLFLFNRSFDSQNFREILSLSPNAKMSPQISYREAGLGDPHDIVLTDSDTIVAANYTAGKISILDRSCGAVIQHIDAEWDLPATVRLRPEALTIVSNAAGEKFILVVHQALSFSNGGLAVDGTQAVFVLKIRSARDLEVVDVEPAKPKVQGIAIQGSLPQLIRDSNRRGPTLLSLCHRNLVDPQASIPCQSALESIDIENLKSEVLWSLDEAGLFMNGPSYGGSDGRIFANVEVKLSDDQFAKKLVELKIDQKETKDLYQFGEKSGGFWGGFYDASTKTIYVGDTDASGIKGRWIIIDQDSNQREIPLDYAPYSGSLIALP